MWRNRIAVGTFFFMNGLLFANWTARLPEIQAYFDISDAELGVLLFAASVGAVLTMPFVSILINRWGSDMVTRVTGVAICLLLPILIISNQPSVAIVFFFMIGAANGSMDVAMNGQAVILERLWNKPIMSSFHAIFSIAMALGAGMGALFAKFQVPLLHHFMICAGVGVLACVVAGFYLVKEPPAELQAEKSPNPQKKKGIFRNIQLPTKAILPLGIIAFCGMTGEGSMVDWSAIYVNKVVGQSEVYAAIAFGVFNIAMTTGRIFGDYFTVRLGVQRLLIIDCTLAIAGLSTVLIFVNIWTTFLGFFMVGLGLATVVPIIYSIAGNTKGVKPSVGIAMATTIGYAGFFVAPPLIGFISDASSLRIGLLFPLLLFVIMFFLILRRFNAQATH